MSLEFRAFLIRFVMVLVAAPILGYGFLYIAEKIEAAWKEKNKKKKFLALSGLAFILEILLGWLQ